jgi:ribosome-associated protein
MMEARKLAELCAQKCLEKKAENVVVLDLEDKSSVADYFVICSGASDRQVSTIADHVADEGRRAGEKLISQEGTREGRWALVDFGSVIVHVFQDHLRDFYSLESLWRDAPRIRVQEDGSLVPDDGMARLTDFEPGSARF